MRHLKLVTFGLAILASAPTAAWAQAITASDISRLEATADSIEQRTVAIRRSDPALATTVARTLVDLRDDIAFLRVKLRRNVPITAAEYADVRDRLEALRVKAGAPAGARGGTTPPAGPPPRPEPRQTPAVPQPLAGEPRAWTDKAFVNFGVGTQFNSQTVTADFSYPLYDEIGTAQVSHPIKNGAIFDATGGVRIGKRWGAALNLFGRSGSAPGTVTASVPDPVLFDHPRLVTSTLPKMTHHEFWIAPLFVYVLPLKEKVDLMVMVGPALAKLTHDLATSVAITEGATAPSVAVGVTTLHHSYITFEVGADVRYLLTKNVGVGGFFRYGGTKANVSSTLKVTLGGVQVGGGIRVRY